MSEVIEPFLRQLRRDLSEPLPGHAAQLLMEPRPLDGAHPQRVARPDSRQGGVLVLFYPHQGDIWLPLIQRPTYNGVHSGQVALPGGGHEDEDADLVATALREAYEEVGVHPSTVEVLGSLTTLYVHVSDYLVHPTVGWTNYRPRFRPDPYEVAELIEVSLPHLLDETNRGRELRRLRNVEMEMPYFTVDERIVWGATAMMLSELLALPAMRLIHG